MGAPARDAGTWLTYAQAARHTGWSIRHLRNLVSGGRIPVYGRPRVRRFRRDMLDLFLTNPDMAMRKFRAEKEPARTGQETTIRLMALRLHAPRPRAPASKAGLPHQGRGGPKPRRRKRDELRSRAARRYTTGARVRDVHLNATTDEGPAAATTYRGRWRRNDLQPAARALATSRRSTRPATRRPQDASPTRPPCDPSPSTTASRC